MRLGRGQGIVVGDQRIVDVGDQILDPVLLEEALGNMREVLKIPVRI